MMTAANDIKTVYVASSWRNRTQPHVVKAVRKAGFDVYDFRNPGPGQHGFHWEEISQEWQQWTLKEYLQALNHPIAVSGFQSDWEAMCKADACILVMPCGRSAHIEAGYFVGANKRLVILLTRDEPELMYKMADHVVCSISDAISALRSGGAK